MRIYHYVFQVECSDRIQEALNFLAASSAVCSRSGQHDRSGRQTSTGTIWRHPNTGPNCNITETSTKYCKQSEHAR
jgi:hypothetical protein